MTLGERVAVLERLVATICEERQGELSGVSSAGRVSRLLFQAVAITQGEHTIILDQHTATLDQHTASLVRLHVGVGQVVEMLDELLRRDGEEPR